MPPEEPNTNFSTPQILGEEKEITEEESLACFVSSVGVSNRGLLAFSNHCGIRLNSNLPMLCHHSLMFANLNENSKMWWQVGSHFLKCQGRLCLGEDLNILNFAWGELTLW